MKGDTLQWQHSAHNYATGRQKDITTAKEYILQMLPLGSLNILTGDN